MTETATLDGYGSLIEPATLKIQRLLPGTAERVWAYLTDSDLRCRWLAAGEMPAAVGGAFALTWRNDELTDPPGERPEGFGAEHRIESRILEFEPPRRLAFTFGGAGEVSFELEPRGEKVLLTVIHRRLPDRPTSLKVGAGWHAHLDILAARLSGSEPEPFWDRWSALKPEYERRIPG
ncbi:Uncharacterized conserved protein YndB, AHSA1/START domain [Tistlia consotensis]|uniref:Uncharacterized conserved protein YndB, AHSA1/START domain n=1 Tax=Tistlia consotensis USBA 355 TaxID=560819 RepID=A0A1Y6C1M8_9PROT|nr:SRPBCC family protein [Tistlia consotensis]SMF37088.1 Uncharacterized conserved protein YndB, AHSA1/START domain [Tistlia consotensis USBA 355]SNR72415.1 Uncharacterized conserved protein YndB, AHSA1/START domain [Tistlia consotensis]